MSDSETLKQRVAQCACGALSVTAKGEPIDVYACSCLNCQRESGSSFTYAAVFEESAVAIEGDHRTWRRAGESGRWIETAFCPVCGTTVFGRMEAWPEVVTLSAGCFADPEFSKPQTLYWSSRTHHWLGFPQGIKRFETQPE